jgi:cell division protein FtsW
MINAFKKIDKLLLIGVLFLLLIGIWMMSWVSVFNANEKEHYFAAKSYCISQIPNYNSLSKVAQKKNITACLKTSDAKEASEFFCSINNCNDMYFKLHIRNIIIALVGMFVAFLIPIWFWRRMAPLIFIIGFILLIIVLIIPAQGGFTAKSWLPIPVLGLFQPSEAMKLALAFYAALWISKKESTIATLEGGFLPYLLIVALAIGPVMLQPDYGSSIILMAIASSMFFIGGASLMHMGLTIGIIITMGGIAYSSFEYIQKRFDTFLHPELANAKDSYQIDQAHISLGNGGFFGSDNTTESFGFLPEIQGDMIFAATGEYWGFLGMLFLVGIYIFITIRGINIAKNAKTKFSKLLATGIISWFAAQTLVNMMVVTGLFPLTGITLPLLSYGGTSMLITLSALGILLKISASLHEKENEAIVNRRRKRRTFIPTSYSGSRSL